MKRFILKIFQCLLTYTVHVLCKNYRRWSFQYNRDNACRWNVFSSSVTKRKCHKSHLRTFKFKSVLNYRAAVGVRGHVLPSVYFFFLVLSVTISKPPRMMFCR